MEDRNARIAITIIIAALCFLPGIMFPATGAGIHANLANVASAQVIPAAPTFIKIGYGPGILSSVQDGIPVFAPTESMWILSSSAQPVAATLSSPSGSEVSSRSLTSSAVAMIYTFGASSPDGTWTLRLTLQNSTSYVLDIPFVNPSAHPVGLSLSQYSLRGSQMSLKYATSPGSAYDLEVCASTGSTNGTVSVPIPSSLGSGSIGVTTSLGTSRISLQGSTSQPFSFWFSLYYPYSFAGSSSGELISRDLEAASSGSATIFSSSSLSQSVPLNNVSTLVPGRYDLRAFFDSSSGLSVVETRVLILDSGQWFWLTGCNPFQISSTSFSLQENLAQNPKAWPSVLYLMYTINGVESYSTYPLQIEPARIDFIGSPGNARLPYLNCTISGSPNVQYYNTFNGSLYLIANAFPLSIRVNPLFGSEVLQSQSVVVARPFSATQVSIPVGRLDVQVQNNSKPAIGTTVNVGNSLGAATAEQTDSSGSAVFYLPAGEYNISVVNGGSINAQNASVFQGLETPIHFSFTTNLLSDYLPYILASLFVIGVLLNVWMWIIRPKQKRVSS